MMYFFDVFDHIPSRYGMVSIEINITRLFNLNANYLVFQIFLYTQVVYFKQLK